MQTEENSNVFGLVSTVQTENTEVNAIVRGMQIGPIMFERHVGSDCAWVIAVVERSWTMVYCMVNKSQVVKHALQIGDV